MDGAGFLSTSEWNFFFRLNLKQLFDETYFDIIP